MTSISNRRKQLWTEQAGRCCYCGMETWIPGIHERKKASKEATIEHLVPRALGGAGKKKYNQALSYKNCNHVRGIIPHEIFMEIRKSGGNWQRTAKKMRHKTFRKEMKADPFFKLKCIKTIRHRKAMALHKEMSNRVKLIHAYIYV